MRCLKDCVDTLKSECISSTDCLIGDAGYQGLDNFIDNVMIAKKKLKKGTLNEEDNLWNTELASVRSKIERVFGELINKFNILNRQGGFDG